MKIDIFENGVHMLFSVNEQGQLDLLHMGNAPACPQETFHRPAVQLGTYPGFGHWGKHVNTDALSLKYLRHNDRRSDAGRKLEFVLANEDFQVTLHYQFYDGVAAVGTWSEVKNISEGQQDLFYLSSFCYSNLPKDTPELMLCRNGWCQEFMPDVRSPEEWGILPDAKNNTTTTKVTASNTGTWSTKDYLPIGYAGGLFWQIESCNSWAWEFSIHDGRFYVNLSGPAEEHSFHKKLQPGESYTSVKAAVSVGNDMTDALGEMTKYRRLVKGTCPEFDAQPVLFNDYLHCLKADPHTAEELAMIDWAARWGMDYYIMDAGWYADGYWWDNVGQWSYAKDRFSGGIHEIFDYIRQKGMVPGIWVEPEVMGINCPLAEQWPDECFFLRHGKRVINKERYQLDYRHPIVLEHMNATIDRLISDLGVRYFKFDYNIDAGTGTQRESDSFGDGLRQCGDAFLAWVDGLKARHPGVIFEDCSSGGLRTDYQMLRHFHLLSTSDNVDYVQTAVIAANSPLGAVPEQAGVWVCPLEGMTENQLNYTVVSGLAATPYFSGRPDKQEENFPILQQAVEVYRGYKDEVSSFLPFWPLGLNTHREPVRCVAYRSGSKTYVALWQTEAAGPIRLPIAAERCKCLFPAQNSFRVETGESLTVDLGDSLNAGWFVME